MNGRTVEATVAFGSENRRSLLLVFDAALYTKRGGMYPATWPFSKTATSTAMRYTARPRSDRVIKGGAMPLFECTQCHVAENTALSNYWTAVRLEGKPALCSQCDPEIGKWHGKFPRQPAEEIRRQDPRSFIENHHNAPR